MYQIIQDGKTVSRRLLLRKAWTITILSIIPLLLLSAASPYKFHSYVLTFLGLFIPVIEFRRPRKALKTANATFVDWIIIIIANIFILAGVMITGGTASVLQVLLVIPFIFFTAEFGLKMGLLNLIPLGLFILFQVPFYSRLSVSTWLQLLALLILSGALLLVFKIEAGIETHFHQKINRVLHQDELTGLFNRRFIKMTIRQAIKARIPFALIMIDINYFKYFNDYWGHPRGDLLLIQVSHLLRETLAEKGQVARYSGDEFIIVSPIRSNEQTGQSQITEIIETINLKILETHFAGAECFPNRTLTLAYGTVLYPDEASAYDDLIAAADRVLYQNKQNR